MIDSWQTLIEQQTMTKKNEYSPSISCVAPLTQLGVLQVAGEDAQDFMQNIFTNDVNALNVNQGQLNGFCNAKGRLFSLFVLVRRQDSYQLVLPLNMCTLLQQRLSMYILRSKVTITDISQDIVCISLTPATGSAIDSLALPIEDYQANEQDDQFLMKYPSTHPHYLYICPSQKAVELANALLKQQWQITSDAMWEQLAVEAGLPMIFPDSTEKFTPQQVNLDLVGGVSFKKGCYPGQEVVARLHYLGKPSRRMFVAHAQTNTLPDIASNIFTKEGSVAGQIVRINLNYEDSLQLLISLKLTNRTVAIFLENGAQITLENQDIPE